MRVRRLLSTGIGAYAINMLPWARLANSRFRRESLDIARHQMRLQMTGNVGRE